MLQSCSRSPMEQTRLAYELHRPARRHFPRRPVEVKGPHETFQADLVEMGDLAKWNNKTRYLLTVIDIFTKKLYARPVKTKTANDVTDAMRSILQQGKAPQKLQTDQGREFFNRPFQSLMKEYGIHHYHTFSPLKASLVERVNRTLKTKMYRQFTERNTLHWLDQLPNLVKEYNNDTHRTIGMTPLQAEKKKNRKQVLQSILQSRRRRSTKQHFQVGDIVRLSRHKNLFAKGYTMNWTEELFRVSEILPTRPRTYHVVDLLGEPVQGTFYAAELQKTQIPSYARIDKITNRKTLPNGQKMIRVKWKGYDGRFNQWIPVERTWKF